MSARSQVGPKYWEFQAGHPFSERDGSETFRTYSILINSPAAASSPPVWTLVGLMPTWSIGGVINELAQRGINVIHAVEVPYQSDGTLEKLWAEQQQKGVTA